MIWKQVYETMNKTNEEDINQLLQCRSTQISDFRLHVLTIPVHLSINQFKI